MPGHFSNPSYINPGVGGGTGVTTSSIVVATQAARLALLLANAQGRLVKQSSDTTVWCLKPNGVPANSADWELLGYYSIAISGISGLVAELAAKAPLASPDFQGIPLGDTAAPGTNTRQLASTAFVTAGLALKAASSHVHSIGDITSLLTTLNSLAATDATKAPLTSPDFQGIPLVNTAAPGTNTRQAASTAFVTAAIAGLSGGASAAWGTITGSLSSQTDLAAAFTDAKARTSHTGFQPMTSITGLDSALAAKAPLASPAFTGTPTVPTATPGTSTTQAASTAFVQAAVVGGGATETLATLTTKLLGTGNRIGAAVLPHALEGTGDPNSQSVIILSNSGDARLDGKTLVFAGVYSDIYYWSESGNLSPGGYPAGEVSLYAVGAASVVIDIGESADKWGNFSPGSAASTPWLDSPLTGFYGDALGTVDLSEGTAGATASHIGQFYRDTLNNVWYLATASGVGTSVWQLDNGSAAVVTLTSAASGSTLNALPQVDETIYLTSPSGPPVAAINLVLPAVADSRRGQVKTFSSNKNITALAVSAAGGGVIEGQPVTAATAYAAISYQCVSLSANGTWLRLA